MAAVNDPYNFPRAWGTCDLVGYGKLPGYLVAMEGFDRECEWVVQKGFGTSGASTIWRGWKIVENMKIILEAPSPDIFVGFESMILALIPAFNKRPPTFGIRHPMASLIRVDRVSIKSYGIKPAPGLSWQMGLGFIEYKKAVRAAVGPADPAKLTGDPVPKTEAEKIMQGLKDQISNFTKK
jgi:hypothetical protein